MISLTLLYYVFILCHECVPATKSFKVTFQTSSVWTPNEWVEYDGSIPVLEEFTACHWEKLQYFAKSSNNIWSYCTIRNQDDKILNCIQLLSRGISSSAYRTLSFNLWITGMLNETLDVGLKLEYFRHRTWNHVCWYYSSLTGYNRLYYNGKLAASKKIEGLPIIHGSKTEYDYSFVIGQEPDMIGGGFSEDQAFFGVISEFNMWNKTINISKIIDMARCKTIHKGNVVSWNKNHFIFNNVVVEDVDDMSLFCKKDSHLLIFPEKKFRGNAKDACSAHGGTIVIPESTEENNKILSVLSINKNTCSTKAKTTGVWLGLERIDSNWFKLKDHSNLTTHDYNNWKHSRSVLNSKSSICAFMKDDGTWDAFPPDECQWAKLCTICVVKKTPVMTMSGLCKKAGVMHWNYYPQINNAYQIYKFDSYKRNQHISFINNTWYGEVDGDWISFSKAAEYPVGKNEWNWKESGCTQKAEKRILTFSVCDFGQQFTCRFGNCIPMNKRCDGVQDCRDGSDEKECTVVDIPMGYQKLQPPSHQKEDSADPLPVHIDVEVEHIHLIDTSNMMIGTTMKIAMQWKDIRLRYRNILQYHKTIVDSDILSYIWSPMGNLYYDNAIIGDKYKEEEKQVSIFTNSPPLPFDIYLHREEKVYEGKTTVIEVVQRWKSTYTCNFQFTKFPFDRHRCNFIMRIKSPENRRVKLLEESNHSVQYTGNKAIKEFKITEVFEESTFKSSTDYPDNNNFKFTIRFEIVSGHGIKTILFPTVVLWMLSFLTLCLDVEDFTSRNRMSVVILLCIITLFGTAQIKENFPRTTEFKYIDVWFVWYLSSIFLINCHHLMINNMLRISSQSRVYLNSSAGTNSDKKFWKCIKSLFCTPKILNRIAIVCFLSSSLLFNSIYFFIST